jgi:hypothetical protein
MEDVVDYRARIAEYFDRFGRERNLSLPPLSEDGVGAKQPPLDEDRCKKLLGASFTETGDAAFALHPQTGDLYLRILRGLDGLDYEEFEDLVHSIAQTADHWDDKISSL